MDSWAQRNARDKFYQHQKLWGHPPSASSSSSLDTSSRDLLQLDEGEEEEGKDTSTGGIGSFMSASRYFQHDYAAFCAQAERGDPLPALDDDDDDVVEPGSWIEVHRDTHIPDGLLTGAPAWDDAAVQKLFWLVRAGARLSADQTWETTLEGYHNAVRGRRSVSSGGGDVNLPVIRLLLILGGDHWPSHVASAELEKLQVKERELWSSQQRDAYGKYACVARMLVQRYSASATAA
jgi:hypothetical protein